MAVRATMADLIAKVRALIGDKNAPQQFSDQEIQDQLDTVRDVVRYQALRPASTPAPNSGVVAYLDFYGETGYWEGDAQLFGPAWQPLTPATADYITGHWTFASSQIPTVWVVGKIYDIYSAAATLLEEWMAQDAINSFDVKTGERTYFRNQIAKTRAGLVESYRSKAWAITVHQYREDGMPDYGGVPVAGDRIQG
jgi:hypothetical protein